MKPYEIIEVDQRDVACDGGEGGLGHPRVYLHVDEHLGQIQCPYCSRLYLLKNTYNNVA
jgi:uncharacterized Zn-finger protein